MVIKCVFLAFCSPNVENNFLKIQIIIVKYYQNFYSHML